MRTQVLATLGVAAALCALAPAARAQPDVPHGPDLLRVAQVVGLSAAQVAQIRKLGIATQREAIQLQAKLRLAQLELQEAIEGDPAPTEKKVTGLIERIGGLETQLKKGHVLMVLRIRGTVNKAQWEKLQILHAERRPPPPAPPGAPHPPPPPRPR